MVRFVWLELSVSAFRFFVLSWYASFVFASSIFRSSISDWVRWPFSVSFGALWIHFGVVITWFVFFSCVRCVYDFGWMWMDNSWSSSRELCCVPVQEAVYFRSNDAVMSIFEECVLVLFFVSYALVFLLWHRYRCRIVNLLLVHERTNTASMGIQILFR